MQKVEKIILASASPRRRELLSNIGLNFEIVESNFDEDSIKRDCGPCDLAKILAFSKAKNVYERLDHGIVLGADTLVVLNNKVYGKPKDKRAAKRMLENLSDNVHYVITGMVLMDRKGQVLIDSDITKVFFRKLDKYDIDSYIETKDYIGKAGAYGIQGKGAVLIKKIEGSYSNVVGLSIEKLYSMFKEIGEDIYARWN